MLAILTDVSDGGRLAPIMIHSVACRRVVFGGGAITPTLSAPVYLRANALKIFLAPQVNSAVPQNRMRT